MSLVIRNFPLLPTAALHSRSGIHGSLGHDVALGPRRERYLLAGLASEEAAFSCFTGTRSKQLRNLVRQTHFAGYANLSELAQAFTLIDANSAD